MLAFLKNRRPILGVPMKTFLLAMVFVCSLVSSRYSYADSKELSVTNLETCFSPNEGCDQKLIGIIASANKTLDVAIYSIAHPGIANAIIAAQTRGVTVRMVVDKSQSVGAHSETGTLTTANVPLKIGNVAGIMHDKFTIVDGIVLETGSFNYSNSATSYNAENQIYITNKDVIQKYQDNFEKLWTEGLTK